MSTPSEVVETTAARQLRVGMDLQAAGRIDLAIAAFQAGLADDRAVAKEIADLHFRLGNAWFVSGGLDAAEQGFKAALRILPNLTSCWCNLGSVYLRTDRAHDALTVYMHAVALDPAHWAARTNLVEALIATRQAVVAKALLIELIAERPLEPKLYSRLGQLHVDLAEPAEAVVRFEQAIALDPTDADSRYWIGSIRQSAGEQVAAQAAYAQAARLQPVIRRPASRLPAEFRVLALHAPFGGNTPTELLFDNASYDINTVPLLAGASYDAAQLRFEGHIVVNLVSDADQAQGELPIAAALVDALGKPVVNDPRRIQRTTREAMALLLATIPGCRVPRTVRCAPGDDVLDSARQFALPLLVRPAGTHGGDDFEKLESLAALPEVLSRNPGADHYLIDYVDYRSGDGYFRKYRFIFVNDEILPYHLAIGRDWKLHHDSTDMGDHEWMRQEELAFLTDPTAFFRPANMEALRTIQRAVGLQYSGIDCGLDASGHLVVFEVNASMLVHQHNEAFAYKAPFVQRIKRAFDDMLRALATASDGLTSGGSGPAGSSVQSGVRGLDRSTPAA